MATFTNCLQIVNAMPEQDQDALLARLDELQAQGLSPKEAQLQAAIDVLAQVEQAANPDGGADPVDIRWSPRRGPAPKKTVTAYKLFRVDAKQPGKLFPLFVNANDPINIGEWLDADEGPMQGGKVKSKLGPLAYRPGWHAGDLPIATHIGGKSDSSLKKPDTRPDNQVWAEIEMAADKDWQTEANKRGTNADGKLVSVRAHITDQIPKNGFYRYKTNPNMTGNWLIGGSMKVNRILSDEEVESINAAAGTADLQREKPFNAKKYGFDIRKSADRTWSGDGYRALNYNPPRNATVKDLVEFESKELGNTDIGRKARSTAKRLGIDLASIPASDAIWVTRTKEEAQQYGSPDEISTVDVDGWTILADLAEDGALLIKPSIRKSPERPQFYSQLQRAIEDVPARLDNMGAIAWKQWLTANAPKLGVKAEEVEWSGIKDYLDLQGKKKLSKDELSSYLDESGVKVSEVMLGRAYNDDGSEKWEYQGETKYSQYTLPGGENYRELLITMPGGVSGKELAALDERIQELEDDRDGAEYDERDEIDGRIAAVQAERKALLAGGYRSSHWDEPNVLAHIRVNDRTDADGKRVLFVEEVQSDWGQDGKKKGFTGEGRAVPDGIGGYKVIDKSGKDMLGQDGQVISADTPAEALAQVKSGVPIAPFVGKTEGWLSLALKRIAMMAVEGGYDKVAFVNGEQSADRYDLSKSIDSIKFGRPKEDGTIAWVAMKGGKKVAGARSTPGELEQNVGKEIAKKILDSNGRAGELSGLDLKVGGEGMKTFYDKIVPQAVSKLLPKIGGEKLGTVAMGAAAKYRAIQADADGGGEVVTAEGETVSFHDTAEEARAEARRLNGGVLGSTALEQPGFDVTDKMRETVGQGLPLFSRDRTQTAEFKKWFGNSKVVDAKGKPRVVYHGTVKSFDAFDADAEPFSYESDRGKQFFLDNPQGASDYAIGTSDAYGGNANVMPVYLRMENPRIEEVDGPPSEWWDENGDGLFWKLDVEGSGHDGLIVRGDGETMYVTANPKQIKSATGNDGSFDPGNADIRKSTARKPWFDDLSKMKVSTNYQLGDLLKSSKKLNWWNRTVGTQYNLAQRNPEFKRVFDAVQTFINDVSAYATQAADLAPSILPKLDGIRDVLKKPLSLEDVKALRDPVFGGTLNYTRDEDGKLVETDDVQKAGVVFSDAELRDMFKLNDRQIGLYREFRQATDRSLTDLALSDMVRYLGEDGADIRTEVMATSNVTVAAGVIESHLREMARNQPAREASLLATIDSIKQKADQANNLMDRGYAPLSRFGQYTVYAVGKGGEQLYFGMFETQRDANKMQREMQEQYPDAQVTTGVMSQESYKLFSGVTPETLALFGESLGFEESGIDPKSEAFQTYLKLAKTNRSAMKRLIQRKGIDGYSEDAGRVLAGFVYSNARQISTNLNAGEIGKAASDVKDGDVKDHAIRLMQYIQNPTEEAQKLKGLLFTVYLGGNISSAAVNLSQTATTTFPYLAQFDSTGKVLKRLGDATKLAARGIRNDDELKQALKRAEDEGIVSPQEVFALMAQAQGKAQLQSGDGTVTGDALAKTNNFMTKAGLTWGRLFSAAEQANRRIAFIAAYKLARDKNMENPFAFAEKAVLETQFSTNKGIRPVWARGAVGGVLFTFKGFTVSYLELLGRMLGNGPEGKKAFALALGTLFLFAGAGGLPFVDDLDDAIDAFAQRVLNKSFDSKQAKKEFFASIFGQSGAEFVMSGISSLPGAPIDVSGRLGLGNIVPGTGALKPKNDASRDIMELFGPAGSLFSNYASAMGSAASGDFRRAAEVAAPLGIQNLIKGMDMAASGQYRDTRGRRVIDVNGWEALAKSMGFQPASVKKIQEATWTQQEMVAFNRLVETKIVDKMVKARTDRKPELMIEAQEDLAEWNRKNPDQKISIKQSQVNRRVQEANKTKAQRLAAAAPKEIRQAVKEELEGSN